MFVINHRRSDPQYRGKERSTVEILAIGDKRLEHLGTVVDDYHLRSLNDLAATGLDCLYLVNDSGMCASALEAMEPLLSFRLGAVVYYTNGEFTTVTRGINGGVGIAVHKAGRRLYVSLFADKKIRVYDIDRDKPGTFDPSARDVPLPLGPDNPEWYNQGNLWLAGGPIPGATILYLVGLRSKAPSMVARIEAGDPNSTPQPVFSDDGTTISASSVGAYDSTSGRLLIGSPFGDHHC